MFLRLDAQLYRERLPALTDDEVRREYLSLADRLTSGAGPAVSGEVPREALENRQSAVASVITQRCGLPDVTSWVDLINFDPSRELTPGKQALADASGPLNLDYYAVEITRPPAPGGRVMSPAELLDAMRANLNAFVGDQATFWDLGMDTGFDGAIPRPGSADALGKEVHIDMGSRDDGTVVVTENEADHWRLSTVFALTDMEHPVSGTREWGVVSSDNGSFTVYVRGADRPTGAIDDILSSTVFEVADNWWRGWQHGVFDFVARGGGEAHILPPTVYHVDWDKVDTFAHRHGIQPYAEAGRAGLFHGGPPPGLDPAVIAPVIDLDISVVGDDAAPLPPLDPSVDTDYEGLAGSMSVPDGPYALSLDPSVPGVTTLIYDDYLGAGAASGPDPNAYPAVAPLDPVADELMSTVDDYEGYEGTELDR